MPSVRLLALALTLLATGLPATAEAGSERGKVSEYPLARGTHAQALTAGPDGNIWFAGLNYGPAGVTDILGKVTPKGKVTEFRLGTHAANVGLADIAVGPEGNLWFTQGGRAKIGRSTTAGAITEFDVPTAGAGVSSITTGADGNLWFTEEAAGKVGRITPQGVVTEFPLKAEEAVRAGGIAASQDGFLWVVESATIARVGTDGLVADFSLPEPARYPRQIVAGPDGALWFGHVGASLIRRITSTGTITEFEVPGGRQTYALAWGPAGDLWYSNGGGRIGSMTASGATATPACIRSCRLPIASLAQGPEGRLWFAAGTEPLAPASARGTVGTFAPPPLEAAIVADRELRGRLVRVDVHCRWGAAGSHCDGQLRLSGATVFGERRLQLRLGAERSFALRLPAPARRLLAERGRLVVKVETMIAGGRRDVQRVVLRQP